MRPQRSMAKLIFFTLLSSSIAGCGALGSFDSLITPGGSIRVDSEPSDADMFVMGKHFGKTPAIISESDIYPVTYSPETEQYYGKVILRKNQCEEFSKRVTRSDFSEGLTARLVCDSRGTTALATSALDSQPEIATEVEPPASNISTLAPKDEPESAALVQRNTAVSADIRLQQLRALQELLEEGLMTREEEETLRKRILNAE